MATSNLSMVLATALCISLMFGVVSACQYHTSAHNSRSTRPHIMQERIGAKSDGSLCGATMFSCRSVKKCISHLQVCDGRLDCGDGSDEDVCGSTTRRPDDWNQQQMAGR